MKIGGVHSSLYPVNKVHKTKAQGNFSACSAPEEPPVWKALREQFDIRRASFADLCSISRGLYETGEIALKEHAILTFNPESSPQWNEVSKGQENPHYFLTKADSLGRRDWIKEYEARVEADRRIGNVLGYKNNLTLLTILTRLQRV